MKKVIILRGLDEMKKIAIAKSMRDTAGIPHLSYKANLLQEASSYYDMNPEYYSFLYAHKEYSQLVRMFGRERGETGSLNIIEATEHVRDYLSHYRGDDFLGEGLILNISDGVCVIPDTDTLEDLGPIIQDVDSTLIVQILVNGKKFPGYIQESDLPAYAGDVGLLDFSYPEDYIVTLLDKLGPFILGE